jgi:hypothetical protein
VLQNVPVLAEQLKKQGIDLASLPDDQAKQTLTDFARAVAGHAGMEPAPKPVQLETIQGPDGAILQRDPTTGKLTAALGREPKTPQIVGQYVPLTPREIEAAGLPAGTSAQRDTNTGKIDVLSKKDSTAALSQKDATTAKIKINQIKVARQQLQNVRDKFEKIRGTLQAGKGQGWVPSEAGEAFDKAVNSMKGSLTAITRVPGVGSMSDYESRIDQSKFPQRGDYESVTDDQIAQLDELLNTIESGYTDLMGGSQQQPAQAPAQTPQRAQAPQSAIDYLKANPQFKGAFQQKYGYVP